MDLLEYGMCLQEEILQLISLQQEGGYWDFKRQWYTNKTDMLHDIICMSNNLHNRAAYIIIGIDEEKNYSVVDVSGDPNRKNTQKIVDFLKDKKFAGGIRPIVHVESVCCPGGTIDVIVIENSHNTPFYLTNQYEGVHANNIYTRIMDTNTPKDSSADINHVEQLWRKRFHLDDTPIMKFHQYLKNPGDWKRMQENESGYFYKYFPEYTITCETDESRTGYEYYMFGQVDTTPNWWLVTLRYYQTAIEQLQGITLDGGNDFVVAPMRAYDLYRTGISAFGFYIWNDLRYRLLDFFHAKESAEEYPYTTYMKAIALFQSESEHTDFLRYVQTHIGRYKELYAQQDDSELPPISDREGYNMEVFRKEYRDALVIQKMLSEFRRCSGFGKQ